jgi:hypothetical protein
MRGRKRNSTREIIYTIHKRVNNMSIFLGSISAANRFYPFVLAAQFFYPFKFPISS